MTFTSDMLHQGLYCLGQTTLQATLLILLILLIQSVGNSFHLWHLVKKNRPVIDSSILNLLEDCKEQMGVQTLIGIIPADAVKSPALFGFIRPRLLLPTGMIDQLSREQLRFVFLHELGHLKRHDVMLGWLCCILQALHWFNPLVWLAFYRMRADREMACDQLALAQLSDNEVTHYGQTIVSM